MNITEAKSIIDTNYTGLLAPNNITLNTEKPVPVWHQVLYEYSLLVD